MVNISNLFRGILRRAIVPSQFRYRRRNNLREAEGKGNFRLDEIFEIHPRLSLLR